MLNASNDLINSVGLGVEANSPFAALTFTTDQRLLAAIDDRIYSLDTFTGGTTGSP